MENEKDAEKPAGEPARPALPDTGPPPATVRSGWLVVLAVVAALYALHWSAPVLIPIMLGVLISYAFSPIVNFMEKWHIHRAIGSAVVVAALIAGTGWLAYSLGDEVASISETLPLAAQKFRQKLSTERGPGTTAIENVQKAATELEKAATESASKPPAAARGVTRVQIEKPKVDIQSLLWSSTVGALTFFGQFITVLFFSYFLMAAGDKFRRKIMNITGTRLSEKRVTIEVLNEITQQIQRYLLVQIFTSALVGVASWLAFSAIGLENAAIWGIAAGVLNTVPYFGPVIVSCGIATVAFVQFGTFGMAFWAAGIALLITSIEGYLLTPWLVGRAARINAVVVFTSVIVGGWLWGAWGLLLAVPVVMILKAICDRVEDLKPLGELLGD
jgi:predicted PurR-regulated permease PerM